MFKTALFVCLLAKPSQVWSDTSPALKNEDILALHANGFSEAVIKAKITTGPCHFDTAPEALTKLKTAGIQESVILEMINCKDTIIVSTPNPTGLPVAGTPTPKGYELTFVKSDLKWKYGFRSEPFNKISEYAGKTLTAALEAKGVHRMPIIDIGCCRVVVELLEVTTHPALIKKPGIDASANVSVRDTNSRLVFSKGYRGESRTLGNTWGHLINHAVEDLVINIAADPDLIRVLATGSPN